MLAIRNTSTVFRYFFPCKIDGVNRLYQSQLALSERHLDSLLEDTSSALELLASLSESFKTVESQTTAFQAQCEDLLAEQKKLRDLADEIGTDLQYYAYLEPLTRRLNTPGSGRLARNDDFLDMLRNLNTCIDFMDQHVSCIFITLLCYARALNFHLRPATRDATKNSPHLSLSIGMLLSTSPAIFHFWKDLLTLLKLLSHLLFARYQTTSQSN